MSVPAAVGSTDVMNRHSGGVVIVVGVLSIVAGILAIVYPDLTLLALALIAGINLLLLGCLGLVDSITSDDADGATRVLSGVLGLLGVIAGLVVMRRPGESLLAIILILGVWFVVSGLVDVIRALVVPGDRAFRLLSLLPVRDALEPGEAPGTPIDAGASMRDAYAEALWTARDALPVVEDGHPLGRVTLAALARHATRPQ